jgi:flagellar biosynthesis GTPase FlhF
MEQELQVTEPDGDVAEDATITEGSGVGEAPTTPTGSSEAEGSQQVDWEAKLREVEEKAQKDINALRSSLDRNAAQARKQYEADRQRLEQELQQARMTSMSPEDRAKYQQQLAGEQTEAQKRELLERQQSLSEKEAHLNYTQFFIEQGIPKSDLKTDGSVDELVASGWAAVQAKTKSLQEELDKLKAGDKPQTKPGEKPAPRVAPQSAAATNAAPTWADLEKRYGSREEVYRLVESENLPVTIIPS